MGAPAPELDLPRAQLAATLAIAIRAHDAKYDQCRFVRSLRTFREATESPYLDHRLHQFVRAAEGFAVPPIHKSRDHFAERIGRLCAGRARPQLRELYTIRSGIEHLHGGYDRMARLSKRNRHVRLITRTIEAEAVARYLLRTYLLNPNLWPHFQERAAIEAFWSLPRRRMHALWPARLLFSSISNEVDLTNVEGLGRDA
jgi:hypothetical protein